MTKAIIFDCFGVLTADIWHEFRQSLPIDRQAPASELNRQYCAGRIDKQTFTAAVSELTGQTRDFIEQLIDHESDKNEPLLSYIAVLKKSYKIGLLSNVASNWIKDYFLNREEQGYFDAMVFSFEAGVTKPDPKAYQIACERLGVEPSEAVMIDDIDRYVSAAKELGMQGIVYSNLAQLKRDLANVLDSLYKP